MFILEISLTNSLFLSINAHSAIKDVVNRDVARPELQQWVGNWTAVEAGVSVKESWAHVLRHVARRSTHAAIPDI